MNESSLFAVMDADNSRSVNRCPGKSVRMSVYNGRCQDADSVELLVERKNDGTASVVLNMRSGKDGTPTRLIAAVIPAAHEPPAAEETSA